MRIQDWSRLLTLAAIWGFSFIFLRLLAPVLGPLLTAEARVLIAGLALIGWAAASGTKLQMRARWRVYLATGLLNSGIPFVLFSFAALHVPVGYLAVVNSGTPLFGALFAAIWLGERLTPRKVAGLVLGIAGVALISRSGSAGGESGMFALAIGACVLATICYALTGIVVKRWAQDVPALSLAGCSQFAAALALLPLLLVYPPVPGPLPVGHGWLWILANLLGLALFCSAIAYVLFYRLVSDLGPTRATTVTFLIPVFAMAWGWVLLGEPVTASMIAGAVLILGATLLVVRN